MYHILKFSDKNGKFSVNRKLHSVKSLRELLCDFLGIQDEEISFHDIGKLADKKGFRFSVTVVI
jgi:hypothetical protein